VGLSIGFNIARITSPAGSARLRVGRRIFFFNYKVIIAPRKLGANVRHGINNAPPDNRALLIYRSRCILRGDAAAGIKEKETGGKRRETWRF